MRSLVNKNLNWSNKHLPTSFSANRPRFLMLAPQMASYLITYGCEKERNKQTLKTHTHTKKNNGKQAVHIDHLKQIDMPQCRNLK